MDDGGIWLVTGIQAAGKSTVADLLARRFERGVHLRGGQFYRWVVNGWTHADDPNQEEARRLLDLRYRLSAFAADEYAAAGFTVVVQDNIFGKDVTAWLDSIRARPRRLVVLRPNPDVVRQRERARTATTGKVAYKPGGLTIQDLEDAVRATPPFGLWLDSSVLTADATADAILRRADEALVG